MSSTESSPARFYRNLFLVVFAVGIMVRLAFTGMERMWPDEALYAWCAKRIFLHPSLIVSREVMGFHPPLFAAIMSLAHFFLAPETACRMTVLVVNILGIVGIYLLGLKIRGPFLGVFAAIVLSFNFLYLNYAYLILTDGFLAVAVIYFLLLLAYVTPTPPCRRDAWVSVAACAVILIKWPGVLVIPFLAVYYLSAFSSMTWPKRLRKLAVALSGPVATVVLLLAVNRQVLGHWMPDTSALGGMYLVKPVWYYLKDLHNIFIVPYLVVFAAIGAAVMFRREHRAFWGNAWWLVIFLTAISLMKEKDLRYSLPIFGSLALLSGLGVEQTIAWFVKDEQRRFKVQVAALAVLIGFFGWSFQRVPWIMRNVSAEFTGFREAGRFIREETALDANPLLIAASPRIVRYYTGNNFVEFGGRLMGLPKTDQELKNLVEHTPAPVILVLDYWEKTNPRWDLPLPPETLKFIEQDLKFKLVHIVEKEHRVAKGVMRSGPVVAIFRRDP